LWQQYTALSYCWGGDQKVKLQKSNLSAWRSDIPFCDLPQTIQDAVTVTTELGIRFLWIDALCIIQDDETDVVEKLARMADIYQEAHLTVVAARSLTVEQGFLQSRYVPGERGYRLPYMCKNGQMGSVILWKGRETGIWEPINKRA
jgi:Heterokaryon incompatibility protein (HET)